MHIKLHQSLQDSVLARDAADALEACVHCGFCLATCPTYLDTRDERDSPRGRLYLLRELLEDNRAEPVARQHLDRCLTCRSCETTCPSGVRYAEIAEAGRELLEQRVSRPSRERLLRWLLRVVIPHRRRFTPLLRLGQGLRPLLPPRLAGSIPPRQRPRPTLPLMGGDDNDRRVVLLEGCVQSAATPATNQALRRVLARLGYRVEETPRQGCCGALNTHLAAGDAGRDDMRHNIDAWWEALEGGAEAILVSATGCAAQLRDYGRALARDPSYAERAAVVVSRALDPVEFLARQGVQSLPTRMGNRPRLAIHAPCTQQHALRLGAAVPDLFTGLGFELCPVTDGHLCCGSAGTYSILQRGMSQRLRERKVRALAAATPDLIVTANVGCQLHLQEASTIPVRHWLEVLDDVLA
ncbi:MAG: glycolate oxidase subunit GlcF [Halieaceae bacterium]|jgi:glycolate oxidase iron-sulfur subunit|nr:glycolate oxidase subunit GlcF [Halieaceae bacterium]